MFIYQFEIALYDYISALMLIADLPKLTRCIAKAELCLLETTYKNEVKILPYVDHSCERLFANNSAKLHDLEMVVYFQQR